VSCSLGAGEEEEASAWAKRGRSTQVPHGLHSAFRPATWSPFITAVEIASTLGGGPTSSRLPAGWGRVSMLQLWADWALTRIMLCHHKIFEERLQKGKEMVRTGQDRAPPLFCPSWERTF
jgi:hypothetical protein